jgi:hypothetical protein
MVVFPSGVDWTTKQKRGRIYFAEIAPQLTKSSPFPRYSIIPSATKPAMGPTISSADTIRQRSPNPNTRQLEWNSYFGDSMITCLVTW